MEQFLKIRINHGNAGFFAYVTFAINQILYSEREGLTPVVDFGPFSGKDAINKTGANAFYEAAYGENTWEYYFEPVASIGSSTFNQHVDQGRIQASQVHELSNRELWNLHQQCEDSIFNYPYGMFENIIEDANPDSWYDIQKSRAHRVINQYIRPKAHILEIVDDYVARNFDGRQVLGLHLRGTDKGNVDPDTGRPIARVAHQAAVRIVKPEEYFFYIDQYLLRFPEAMLFLATDQQGYLSLFAKRYGDKLLYRDCSRGTGRGVGSNVFQMADGSPYLKGEEVLVDALLLSRCSFLIKCSSAVGEYARYFNPKLKSFDINHHNRASFPFYSMDWGNPFKTQREQPLLGIVVNYFSNNTHGAGYQTIRRCTEFGLQSLLNCERVDTVLLIDGSTRPDPQLRQFCNDTGIRYYHSGIKLSYVESYNLGWRILAEHCDYIGLMANDIIVYPSSTITRLCDVLDDAKVGCVFPYMFTTRHQVDEVQRPGFILRARMTCEPASMTLNLNLFKASVLNVIGGLNERYLYGFSEPILLNAIRGTGQRVVLVGETLVTHFDQLTGQSDPHVEHYLEDIKRWRREYPELACRTGIGGINLAHKFMATTRLTRLMWKICQSISNKKLRARMVSFTLWLEPFLCRYPV